MSTRKRRKYIEQWKCQDCSYKPPEMLVNRFIEIEEKIKSISLLTVDDINRIIQLYPIHETHYLVFWALSEIVKELTSLKIIDDNKIPKGYLQRLWLFLIDSLNIVLSLYHREKVIYHDLLAQVEICDGNIENAKREYEKAYQISCIVSGIDIPTTLIIKDLYNNTPKSVYEMRQRYNNNNNYLKNEKIFL